MFFFWMAKREPETTSDFDALDPRERGYSPLSDPKGEVETEKASRFAKRFFLVSPVYGFAENSKPSAFLSERDITYFYNSEVFS